MILAHVDRLNGPHSYCLKAAILAHPYCSRRRIAGPQLTLVSAFNPRKSNKLRSNRLRLTSFASRPLIGWRINPFTAGVGHGVKGLDAHHSHSFKCPDRPPAAVVRDDPKSAPLPG